MSESGPTVSLDRPESESVPKPKPTRIVRKTSAGSTDVTNRARATGSAATDSIPYFVAARPLAIIAVGFCLGLFVGRRRSR